jgi:hypothetical protein
MALSVVEVTNASNKRETTCINDNVKGGCKPKTDRC